jgi:hypothetical protein
MELNFALSFVPIERTPTRTTTAMRAAIRPYSTAVAAVSSRTNRSKIGRIASEYVKRPKIMFNYTLNSMVWLMPWLNAGHRVFASGGGLATRTARRGRRRNDCLCP